MSDLFDDDDFPAWVAGATGKAPNLPAKSPADEVLFDDDQEAAPPLIAALGDVPLFSEEAHQRMTAAKAKAKAVAKEGAAQAVVAARATASKAASEWLPAARAKWASERARGISRPVKQIGAVMALATVCASAGLWWHAQSHVNVPVATASAKAEAETIPTPVVPPPAAIPIAITQATPMPTAVSVAPVAYAPATRPVSAVPAGAHPEAQEDVGQPGHMKSVSFNPLSPAYKPRYAAPVVAKPKGVEKTAWEKEQDAKLEQWSQRGD